MGKAQGPTRSALRRPGHSAARRTSHTCARWVSSREEMRGVHSSLRETGGSTRNKILDLVGDLALVAERGNAALPVGHIVAYKAGHDLHLKFAQQLLAAVPAMTDEK